MITPDDTVFPNNVVELLAARFGAVIDPDSEPDQKVHIYKRALRPTDAYQSIGVTAVNWSPVESSHEMRGGFDPGPSEATLQQYSYAIQTMVKDADEIRGSSIHSLLSTMVKTVVLRDTPLRIGLTSLSSTVLGATERLKRYGVEATRYLSNEIDSSFVYVSSMTLWVETDNIF